MNKEDNEDFENSTKFWICDNSHVDGDVKAVDHLHITGKYRWPVHRNCSINNELKIKKFRCIRQPINYDSHLIMQKLSNFSLKINVMPNRLEKYFRSGVSNKLISKIFISYFT